MPYADHQSMGSESEDEVDDILEDDEDEDKTVYDTLYKNAIWAIKERKGVFTENDVTDFLLKFREWPKRAKDKCANPLHAIVELLHGNDIPNLDDVLPLVKALVWEYPHLLCTTNDQDQNPVFFALKKQQSDLVTHMLNYSEANSTGIRLHMLRALEGFCEKERNKTCLRTYMNTFGPMIISRDAAKFPMRSISPKNITDDSRQTSHWKVPPKQNPALS